MDKLDPDFLCFLMTKGITLQEFVKAVEDCPDIDHSFTPLQLLAKGNIDELKKAYPEAKDFKAREAFIELTQRGIPMEPSQFIRIVINQFLTPYLNGTITRETDNPTREPFLTQITNKYKSKFQNIPENFNETVLKQYINEAFTVVLTRENLGRKNYSDAIRNLTAAVKDNLPKDFPGIELSDEQVNNIIKDAVNDIFTQLPRS